MDFDLSEALLLGSLAAKQKFLGCSNTSELKDTVAEMFDGIDIVVASIDGKPEEFKAKILTKETNVDCLLGKFQENTLIEALSSVKT